MQSDLPPEHAEPKVASPFADAEVAVPQHRKGSKTILLWAGAVVVILAIGVVGGIFLTRYLNDPYRTLESFPVAKFLENYQSLAGSRFKAELRVEADLIWKENTGRLMLFSTSDDSRPIAVMVPAVVAKDIYFTKGQTYMAELEVKEGGLIYANSCRKN
ncbi:MAG: hypothetical protein LBH01_01115 [Verrucomicrobiales bacterium]|jgi:hypothetical protein|nr:hypothetical protein [Verrucomicrobiales bacterium]